MVPCFILDNTTVRFSNTEILIDFPRLLTLSAFCIARLESRSPLRADPYVMPTPLSLGGSVVV